MSEVLFINPLNFYFMHKIFISKRCDMVFPSAPNTMLVTEQVAENGVIRRVQKVVPFKSYNQNVEYRRFDADVLIAEGQITPLRTYIGTSPNEISAAVSEFNNKLGNELKNS